MKGGLEPPFINFLLVLWTEACDAGTPADSVIGSDFVAGMLDNLISLVNDNTSLSSPLGPVVVIVAVFAIAWLVARTTAWAASRILAWHDRRQSDADLEVTGKIAGVKRRETFVSVIRTGITYVTFAIAVVVAIGQLTGGVDRLTAFA